MQDNLIFKSKYFANLSLCPICFSKNIQTAIDPKLKDLNFMVITCQECEVSFTNPQIKKEYLPFLYDGQSDGKPVAKNNFLRKLRSLKLIFLIKKMQKNYDINSTKCILDYGCGDGLLTELLKKRCKDAIGVDFSLSTEYLGNDTHTLYLSDDQFRRTKNYLNQFDFILLRHVLEHTTNPDLFLLDLSKYLKKNGKFIIEVPNFESPWRYIFKKHYSQLGLPFHTFHFSPKSIANAIPNFKILSITKASVPVLAKSFLKIFNVKISELGILTTCFYPLQSIFDIFFKNHTAMIILCEPLNDKET